VRMMRRTMRQMIRDLVALISLTVGCLLVGAPIAAPQDTAILMPEQSAAKARQLIQQAIDALGGNAYLNMRDITCSGRAGQFGHSGELNGFETFVNYAEPPNMERTENLPKRNIIEVYNGDKGWTMDRGGVSEASITDIARFQEDVRRDTYNIFRNRIHEDGMIVRYGGLDIVNLHEVDWVELVDADDRTIRFAIERMAHLPIEKVVRTRDPKTGTITEEIELYSNYHPINGIQTPFQIERNRNAMKTYQVFFDKCDYNTGLPASLFTKESLDEKWEKIGKGEREKQKKQQQKEEKYSSPSSLN
jgi:hypothetical protein